MKQIFSLVALLAVFAASPQAGAEEEKIIAQPPIWRIADNDTEIFLVGTFHVLPENVDWRSRALANAIDRAETVWFETETDSPLMQETVQRILQDQGLNKEGVDLSSFLSDEERTKLQAISEEVGIPATALEGMRPWYAFLALSAQLAKAIGYGDAQGVDTILLSEMRARGRELRFFESGEAQLSSFTSLSPRRRAGGS